MKSSKTLMIGLKSKNTSSLDYACGSCFSVVDVEDSYCWECGIEFIEGDTAYNLKDLIEKRKLSKT